MLHTYIHTLLFKIDDEIDHQKYSEDIVNVVNEYCSWKRLIFNGIST
jgi:hypothetical protein